MVPSTSPSVILRYQDSISLNFHKHETLQTSFIYRNIQNRLVLDFDFNFLNAINTNVATHVITQSIVQC